MKSYKTILKEAEYKETIQKSKFIATCIPVHDETQAINELKKLKKQYSNATHNCFAYVIKENSLQRYSDDGEPQGTAGLPILNAITSFDLYDVLINVTRYFGGTLLGTGGLVRAYGSLAKGALELCDIKEMIETTIFHLQLNYEIVDIFKHYLNRNNYCKIISESYSNYIDFEIAVQAKFQKTFLIDIAEMSLGKLEPLALKSSFLPW